MKEECRIEPHKRGEVMRKIVFNILFLLLTFAACIGQTSYKGLTPGKSMRSDVERALGKPVKELSKTLVEYRPQPLTGQIFVQYREGSAVVERMEMICQATCDDLIKSLKLRLPKDPGESTLTKPEDDRWKFLYGAPHFIVTSGAILDLSEDGSSSSRVAFYSRELYEADFAGVKETNEAYIAKIEEDQTKPPVPEPGQITGIVRLNGKPIAGATIDFYRTDLASRLQTKTNSGGVFISTVFRGNWVVVISGPGMKWTYVSGLKIPLTAALEVDTAPGDGVRPTEEQVRTAIK